MIGANRSCVLGFNTITLGCVLRDLELRFQTISLNGLPVSVSHSYSYSCVRWNGSGRWQRMSALVAAIKFNSGKDIVCADTIYVSAFNFWRWGLLQFVRKEPICRSRGTRLPRSQSISNSHLVPDRYRIHLCACYSRDVSVYIWPGIPE